MRAALSFLPLAFLAAPPLPAIGPYAGPPVARAARVEGWVELSDRELGRRWELPRNSPLLPGDRFELQSGARLRIDLAGEVRLVLSGPAKLALARRGDGAGEVRLARGELWVENRSAAALRVGSDYGALEIPAGGRVLLFCGGNGVDAYAVAGDARRLPPRGAPVSDKPRELPEGTQIALADGKPSAPEDQYVADARALARWAEPPAARPRDPRLAAWLAATLPAQSRGEWADLDEGGEWRETGNGWAWFPRVEGDWAPFTRGGWRWTAAGLFWIPEEPWGWLPYRYGSWQYRPDGGWRWRPDDQYTGASVVFYALEAGWGWGAASASPEGWAPASPQIWQFGGGALFGEKPLARAIAPPAPRAAERPAPPGAKKPPAAPRPHPVPVRAIPIPKPAPGRVAEE